MGRRFEFYRLCDSLGVKADISNHGLHWKVRGRLYVDWWPSTGKLVIGADFSSPALARTIDDAIEIIRDYAEAEGVKKSVSLSDFVRNGPQ